MSSTVKIGPEMPGLSIVRADAPIEPSPVSEPSLPGIPQEEMVINEPQKFPSGAFKPGTYVTLSQGRKITVKHN